MSWESEITLHGNQTICGLGSVGWKPAEEPLTHLFISQRFGSSSSMHGVTKIPRINGAKHQVETGKSRGTDRIKIVLL